jgi:predicted enzyme related to lactoylglutathione lyase
MHRSQLGRIVIDCQTDDLEAAVRFWSAALGLKPKGADDPNDAHYVIFERDPNGIDIEVQQVAHPSRVHLDIETDDLEAEAARLEKLGARKVRKIRNWWVMEAPTGQRFCLVRASRSKFAEEANLWP